MVLIQSRHKDKPSQGDIGCPFLLVHTNPGEHAKFDGTFLYRGRSFVKLDQNLNPKDHGQLAFRDAPAHF